MPSERHRIFLLPNDVTSPFYEKLFQLFDYLECSPSIFSKWDAAITDLLSFRDTYRLLIIDPSVNGFKLSEFQDVFTQMTAAPDPKILLVTPDQPMDLVRVAEALDADARISAPWSPYGLAFILKRLLCDVNERKRKDPRIFTEIEVKFSTYDSSHEVQAQALNISSGGMFVRSEAPEKRRAFLTFYIDLPDGEPTIECTGRVVHKWRGRKGLTEFFPSGMGVQFKGINELDRERIERFVASHLLRTDRKHEPESNF